ncbi:MAG: general secretion pathway protein GspK [Burkholderiaceae bacterium]|jgi:general secretion pathway protein K|nr:general secretion pathway protein GspK [Burkholderiaceae bacterium]
MNPCPNPPASGKTPGAKRSTGLALIAVLWIVAALSIMVTGMIHTVRQQTGIAVGAREQLSGQALAEAAAALVLQDMLSNSTRLSGAESTTVSYGGVQMEVEAAPLNGWIALNGANAVLLAALLQNAGGLDPGHAQALADAIVEWRDTVPQIDPTASGGAPAQQRRFEATEDLLLVPGMDYPLYSRIAPLVSADFPSGPLVNLHAAPPEVLSVLAQGDMGRVAQYVARRADGEPGDASGFSNASARAGDPGVYRLRVKVPLDAGKILLLTSDVASAANTPGAAPWRVLRTERQMTVSPSSAAAH